MPSRKSANVLKNATTSSNGNTNCKPACCPKTCAQVQKMCPKKICPPPCRPPCPSPCPSTPCTKSSSCDPCGNVIFDITRDFCNVRPHKKACFTRLDCDCT